MINTNVNLNKTYTISNTGNSPILTVGQQTGAALSIQGDMEFTKSNSFLEVDGERVSVRDLVKMTQMFKRLMFDIANDPELAARFPYVKEGAHEWAIEVLKK